MNIENILFVYTPLFVVFKYILKNNLKLIVFYDYSLWIPLFISIPFIHRIGISEIIYIYSFIFVLTNLNYIKSLFIHLKRDPIIRVIMLFTAIFIIHFILGRNHDTLRSFFYKLTLIIQFMFFLFLFIKKNPPVNLLIKYYFISYLILTCAGIITLAFPSIFPQLRDLYYSDYGGSAFRYYILQSAFIPLLYSLVYFRARIKFIAIPLFLTIIIISNSRFQLILSVLCIILYYFELLYETHHKNFQKKKSRIYSKLISLLICIAVIVGVYGSIQNLEKQNEVSVFIKRFQDVIINPEKASGARFFYWDLSIELIKQRPLFGNKIYSNQEMTAWGYGLVERSAYSGRSHNNYIAVTYAYGIVGFLVYLTLIYFVYKKLRWLKKNQNNSSHQFLNFVFISNVVGGLFVGDYFNFVCSPFILALIVYAGQNIHKNDMEFTPPRKR